MVFPKWQNLQPQGGSSCVCLCLLISMDRRRIGLSQSQLCGLFIKTPRGASNQIRAQGVLFALHSFLRIIAILTSEAFLPYFELYENRVLQCVLISSTFPPIGTGKLFHCISRSMICSFILCVDGHVDCF